MLIEIKQTNQSDKNPDVALDQYNNMFIPNKPWKENQPYKPWDDNLPYEPNKSFPNINDLFNKNKEEPFAYPIKDITNGYDGVVSNSEGTIEHKSICFNFVSGAKIKKEDITLDIKDRTLTIVIKYSEKKKHQSSVYNRVEGESICSYTFSHSIVLNANVILEDIKAELNDSTPLYPTGSSLRIRIPSKILKETIKKETNIPITISK